MVIEIPEPASLNDVESVLRRRGHRILREGNLQDVLFPSQDWDKVMSFNGMPDHAKYFRPEPISPYMTMFAKRSFRKVLKILIENQPNAVNKYTLRKVCGDSIDKYLELLRRLVVTEEMNNSVALVRALPNLGPSLEHYVSQLMIKEFRGSSKWGVILDDLPNASGDFDVLAWLAPSLAYIECKTSDPRNISTEQIRHFMLRSLALAPDIAILLVDTDDSVEEFVTTKVDSVIRRATKGDWPDSDDTDLSDSTLVDYPGIYSVSVHPPVYVTGTKPSIETQIARCLKHFYSHIRGFPFYVSDVDFNQS